LWQPDGRTPRDAQVRWAEVVNLRDHVNRELESVRSRGDIGSSLQAVVSILAPVQVWKRLVSFGDDLKFLLIVSKVELLQVDGVDEGACEVRVVPSSALKCERCWHYRDDVGRDAAHPAICGRCVSNLFGAGEARTVA
jgi:isoleucyl-tRNA synthetase